MPITNKEQLLEIWVSIINGTGNASSIFNSNFAWLIAIYFSASDWNFESK